MLFFTSTLLSPIEVETSIEYYLLQMELGI